MLVSTNRIRKITIRSPPSEGFLFPIHCETITVMKLTNDNITFYFQLTNDCNAMCKHCYCSSIPNKQSNSESHFPHDRTLEFVKEYIETYDPKFINFHIHGGEPAEHATEKDIEFVKQLASCYPLSIITIQSHLKFDPYNNANAQKLLNEVLTRNGSGGVVGTSYQGKDIHFSSGPSPQALLFLKEEYGVRPHLSYILSKENCNSKSGLEWLVDYSSVQFERLTKSGRANRHLEIFPTLEEQNDFLVSALKEILEKGLHKKTKFNFYQAIAQMILFNEPLLGQRRCRQCEISTLTITPDGFVRGCPDESDGQYIGHVSSHAKTLIEGHPRKCLIIKEKQTSMMCIGCDYYKTICRGDCYKQKWESPTECRAPKKLYDYMSVLPLEILNELV